MSRISVTSPQQQASLPQRRANSSHTPSQFENTECVACNKPLIPPVYQCCKGHLVCSDCCDEMELAESDCSVCQSEMPYPRAECLFFKQIARRLQYICPYSGCNAKLRYTEFHKHRDSCKYRPFQCGYCDECLEVDCMSRHMMDKHKDAVTVLQEKQVRETLKCFSAEGSITCPETQICHRNKMLIILDIASDEAGKHYYAFPVVLAPGEDVVRCRLCLSKEDSRLTWEGKAYSYETWLQGYDAMIREGRPFPIAVDGDYSWSTSCSHDEEAPRFSYRLEVLFNGVAPNAAAPQRPKLRQDNAGSTPGGESLPSGRPLSARSSARGGYGTRCWK